MYIIIREVIVLKLTKKLLSLTLSLLLVLSTVMCMSAAVSAASGDTIYFEKPDSWDDDVRVYFWNASSGNPSWPGYSMTRVSGNIYSYTCKNGFTKLLFNEGKKQGEHGKQTVDVDFPGNGYICKVLSTGNTNGDGNFCNDAEWSKFEGVSDKVSVSASPKGCDFLNSLDVTLYVNKADKGTYKINGGSAVEYTNGTKITIGADAGVGDKIKLALSAGTGEDAVSETYTYTKVSTPIASSLVYFDNSGFKFDDVYLYAYGAKENAEWPGEKMQKDDNGLYYYAFSSKFSDENIIVNNGKEGEEKVQYPKSSGLRIKSGECKLLTAENEWVDYGTPDSKPAGFSYTASGTSFKGDSINVKIGLKNAVKGTYQVDGGTVFEYTGTTTVSVGQGAIGNKDVKLTLTATSSSGEVSSTDYIYKKTFEPSKTTFSASGDGHTSEAVTGHYGTNPNMQLGKNKTITVDGNPSEWDSSMIIAQGVANDDPRVYMPSSMHEQPWDDYALYAAWDNENLYFMWEMANTTYVVSPSDNFAASQESRPWRNSIPIFIALSVNPIIHADGTVWGTDAKSGAEFTNPFVWGCIDGKAKDGGVNFKTNVDTLIAFDTNNSNGGASIFKADKYDAANDNYMFNYDTAIPIGVTSFEKQDNQNGFKIAHDYGTLSDKMIGVGGAKGSHTVGDSLSETSNWVDFYDLGYKKEHGFIYETAIPLKNLGIDKNYIETKGIGAMQILTYGTSGMDCLPYDATMQDNADVEYSYDPSTSHEKEDVDLITVPLARIGALLPGTVVNEAPFEVNFGADKAGTQGVGSSINLKAVPYNGEGAYSYSFKVNGKEVQNSSSDTYLWKPAEKATYDIAVSVTDKNGKTAVSERKITIGDEPAVVTEPATTEPKPTSTNAPTVAPSSTAEPYEPTEVTDASEATQTPTDEPTIPADEPTETSEQITTQSETHNPDESIPEPATVVPTEPVTDKPAEPGENPSETTVEPVTGNPTDIPGESTAAPTADTPTDPAENPSDTPTDNPTEVVPVTENINPTSTKPTPPSNITTDPTESVKKNTSADTVKKSTAKKKTVKKKSNPIKIKTYKKTVKIKKLKKKAQTLKKAIKVTKAKGKVTYKLVKKGTNKKIWKYLKISKKGAVTVKKWKKAKKGTYKIRITVTAAGNKTYKKGYKTVTVKVKIK